jgi:3-hydroxyisobutyrate dehydrogenase-like beta-hydroxyacid dehydrogenase
MKERLGMIGIGMMGHGIAGNLLRHGYRLTVLEHPGNQPLDALLAAGATTARSARALAADAEVVILCVTGSAQVEAALTGNDGVIEGLRAGAVVIDCSTALPASTVRMAQAVAARGARMIDAAMTRTPKEAAEGRLNLLVGGDAEVVRRCRPILASFAESITHVGGISAGHRMKLLHNFVSLGQFTLLAEAAACARTAAIDPAVFLQVLATGGGGGTALERLRPFLESGETAGMRFAIGNGRKDLDYYVAMATDAGSRHGVADAILATLDDAVDAGHGDELMPELVAFLAGAPVAGRDR